MVATVARFRRRISRRRRILFAARFSRRLRTASADHGLLPGNYLPEACKGCTVVHKAHPRILVTRAARAGKASFHWDPERKTFTVLNGSRHTRFAYLTFLGVDVLDYECQPFETGVTRAEDGEESSVTTFVVVAEPRTAVTLGTVEIDAPFADFFALPFSKLLAHPVPKQLTGAVACIGFPLPTSHGPYLCTQGNGGHLTHFFPESYHAVDLRCGCGTPVLCIDEGVVESLEEKHHCGGIHCGNLMSWNAVTVRLTCGLIVEYLHTAPNSFWMDKRESKLATVCKGARCYAKRATSALHQSRTCTLSCTMQMILKDHLCLSRFAQMISPHSCPLLVDGTRQLERRLLPRIMPFCRPRDHAAQIASPAASWGSLHWRRRAAMS